jgi:hypothetical protein
LQISGGRWCSTRAWLGELPLLNADAPQDPEHVAEPPWVPTLETRPMKLPAGPVPIRLEFRKRLATNLSVRYRRGDGPWQPLTFEQISHKQDVKSRVQPPERPANVEPGVKVVVHSLVVNEEAGGREMKPIGSIVLPTFEADWSKQPPLPNARRYHTEWSGWLRIDRSGFYRFELAGNGHALMYIDGVAVTSSGVGVVGVPLQQGYRHVAVHFAPGRGASLTLKWQPPAAEQTQPIPAEQLSHAPTGTD